MTFLGIEITLAVGILMLIVGAVTRKKWLVAVSLVPLAIAVVQIVLLYMM